MSDKLPSRLQTLPLKGNQCDLQLQGFRFLLLILLRKSLWSSFVPEPAESELQPKELTEGTTTKRCSFVRRTASYRGQRKISDKLMHLIIAEMADWKGQNQRSVSNLYHAVHPPQPISQEQYSKRKITAPANSSRDWKEVYSCVFKIKMLRWRFSY